MTFYQTGDLCHFLTSEEGFPPRWFTATADEVTEALAVIAMYAEEQECPTHDFDSWNLKMAILEDRSFHRIARHLEGG